MTTLPDTFDTNLGEQVEEGPAALLFDFPFYNSTWQVLEVNDSRYVSFDFWEGRTIGLNLAPVIFILTDTRLDNVTVFVNSQPDTVTVTWQGTPQSSADSQEVVVQLTLYANGMIDIVHHQPGSDPTIKVGIMPGNGSRNLLQFRLDESYQGTIGNGNGIIATYEWVLRQFLHEQLLPLAYLILGASLFILVGFPLFFGAVLVRPLNNLVAGVKAVRQGHLETRLPIYYQDEIGLVTDAFNEMVEAVHASDQRLERLVVERTTALTEREKELAALAERERIGQELHDDLGQVLGYINMQSQAALAQLQQDKKGQLQATLTQLAKVAQDSHTDVRHYILGIRTGEGERPSPPFITALKEYLHNLESLYNLKTDLSLPPQWQESPFSPEVETQLLRIIQESLTNVRKHANTDKAALLFTDHEDEAQVIISDEGEGFELDAVFSKASPESADEAAQSPHFGLSIMRERAEKVGGSLRLRSRPGEGTQIIVRMPKLLAVDSEEAIQGMRVLIADDHKLMLEGLHNMLRTRGVQVVGLARDGLQAQEMAAQLRPNLILMDVEMPVCDGLEATRQIKVTWPEMKVVMLTASADEEKLFTALRYGASGYLLKNVEASQFFQLLTAVLRGETVLSPQLAARVLTSFAQTPPRPDPEPAADEKETAETVTLTFRQQEVLELVVQGLTNQEIAEQLGVTERTIKHHVSRILALFQLKSRYELTHIPTNRDQSST